MLVPKYYTYYTFWKGTVWVTDFVPCLLRVLCVLLSLNILAVFYYTFTLLHCCRSVREARTFTWQGNYSIFSQTDCICKRWDLFSMSVDTQSSQRPQECRRDLRCCFQKVFLSSLFYFIYIYFLPTSVSVSVNIKCFRSLTCGGFWRCQSVIN